jgi:hypothetical protein
MLGERQVFFVHGPVFDHAAHMRMVQLKQQFGVTHVECVRYTDQELWEHVIESLEAVIAFDFSSLTAEAALEIVFVILADRLHGELLAHQGTFDRWQLQRPDDNRAYYSLSLLIKGLLKRAAAAGVSWFASSD